MDLQNRQRRAAPSRLLGGMILLLALGGLVAGETSWARDKKTSAPASMDDLFGGPAPNKPAAPTVAPAESPAKPVKEAGPRSMDDLFGGPAPEPAAAAKPTPQAEKAMPVAVPSAPESAKPVSEPRSVDALFDTAPPPAQAAQQPAPQASSAAAPVPEPLPVPEAKAATSGDTGLTGFFRSELGYAYRTPTHWSKFRNLLEMSGTGHTAGGVAWKLGGRVSYDPIYDLTDHYNSAVRNDQRLEFQIREAYLDIPAGDWEFRLGRQHIIWGEMVGLFFADVVSAKDLRELALQDFEILRIPQWAARAEYFDGDFHAEAVWVPYMTYNDIGKPGAEFYPFTLLPGVSLASERKPRGLDSSAYGGRLSYIKNGWDLSGFVYSTIDPSAAFARLSLAPTEYQPTHNRIHQLGATLGKDLRDMVLKVEAVYTWDKLYYTGDPADADGLVKQDVLDAIVGLEWSFPEETRFNVQFYQHWVPDPAPMLLADSTDSGFSLMYSTQALHPKLETKILFIRSLERDDWLTQLKATWRLDGNWRLGAGADIFGGKPGGIFTQFDDKDRIYTEVQYSF